MGITDPKKTFHCFRHTMINDLRDVGVQDSLIKRIAGHEDSAVTFGVYGSRIPIKAIVEALRHLSLPNSSILTLKNKVEESVNISCDTY